MCTQTPFAYTYENLEQDLSWFRGPEAEISPVAVSLFSIGKSLQNRRLYALKLGRGGRRIFFNGAHHGMEWLTAKVLVQFAQELVQGQYNALCLLDRCTLYLTPMVNPDGVTIAAGGERWQANARGVDLNHNYDALWHLSKQSERENGIHGPGPTRFSGAYPESEPESRAIADFTRQNHFDAALAFHSQGQVIYWDFCGFAPAKSYIYGKRFQEVSCFRLDTPEGMASYGGYKDWFIKQFKRPGFTIEIGLGVNPLPLSMLDTVYAETLPVMLEAIKL